MITKEKIIEILHSHSYNVEDQAGNHLIVIDEDSWDAVATEVKNCSIPDVSQQRELFKSFLKKVVEEIEMNCGDLSWELQDEAKELLKLLNCG